MQINIREILRKHPPVFTQEPDGCYSVSVPDFPGCCSWGENLEHAKEMIEEAAELWVEAELESRYNLNVSNLSRSRELVH